MNAFDEIKNIRAWLADLNRRLMEIRRTGGSGGSGEANTASNVGSAGVGIFDAKVGVDLQFRKANPKSNKVLITLDTPNKKVDFDIDPSKVNLDDLGNVNAGSPADGQVLTWDQAATEWQAKAGGAGGGAAENYFKYRKSGRYYTWWDCYGLTTCSLAMDTIYAIPFIVPVAQTFDRIALYVYGATNRVIRLGIYEESGSVYPGSLVLGTAELDCSSSGVKEETINQNLSAGLYWLAALNGVATGNVKSLYYNYSVEMILGRTACDDATPESCYYASQAYGAMPDPFPGGASMWQTHMPAIMLRVA